MAVDGAIGVEDDQVVLAGLLEKLVMTSGPSRAQMTSKVLMHCADRANV
jgi:hypothetical protein